MVFQDAGVLVVALERDLVGRVGLEDAPDRQGREPRAGDAEAEEPQVPSQGILSLVVSVAFSGHLSLFRASLSFDRVLFFRHFFKDFGFFNVSL